MKKEKVYPIYSFSAKWSQDGEHDLKYPYSYKGLPNGRIWNSTSFSKMYKEEKSKEELDAISKEWFEKFIKTKNEEGKHSILNSEILYLKIEFKKFDTWNLTWFQHETFDEGQTDEEALRSFEDFVTRIEDKNRKIENAYPEDDWYKQGHQCLMGAEDRWRWCGAEPNGELNDRSPAPCRCKFCKEQGVIRIGH